MMKAAQDFDLTIAGKTEDIPIMVWSGGPSVPAFTGIPADQYFQDPEICHLFIDNY